MSEKVQKQVVYFLKAKNLIRFTDSEANYKLSESLLKETNSLLKGEKVEVEIKDGVVVSLSKVTKDAVKVEAPKAEDTKVVAPTPTPEVKKEVLEEKPISSLGHLDIRELTVFAVAANKKVVKFLECKDAGWFQIDPSIQAKDYAVIGLQAKNKAKVQIVENNVVSFEKVAGEAPVKAIEQPKTATSSPDNAKSESTPVKTVEYPKKEWKPTSQYNDDRQKSIECQAMINSACEVAGAVAAAITNASRNVDKDGNVTTNAPTANIINRMIRAIAEENYVLLQELKSK